MTWLPTRWTHDSEHIGINDDTVTDDDLRAFADLGTVKTLPVGGPGITNHELSYLRRCKSLLQLEMRNTSISDDGAGLLADLPRLRELDLTGSRNTDRGLRKLGAAKGLTDLNLFEAATTPAGRAAWRAAHPTVSLWPP